MTTTKSSSSSLQHRILQHVCNAKNDGVDHINIDQCSKTELGKLLSHFAKTPFEHPIYGPFISLEGFWHWLRAKNRNENLDNLRDLHGPAAKTFGFNNTEPIYVDNFKEEIITAIYYKVIQNDRIYDLLLESTLPFKQYYIHGPMNIEINSKTHHWHCKGIEDIRAHIKKNELNSTNDPFIYTP